MQIDGSGSISSHIQTAKESGQTQQNAIEQNKQQQNTNAAVQSDTVTLTSTASQLQQLEQEIAAQPVVDTQRVEQIQQAIKNDSLKYDPQQIAEKVINFESSLNQARTTEA